jgi:hypothetical protein
MSEVKVGDLVRYDGESGCDLTHGKGYQVIEVNGFSSFCVIDDVGDKNWCADKNYTPTHPDPDRYIRILEAMLTDEQVKTANRIMETLK